MPTDKPTDLHDGWTPEPQEQIQPGDPWRDPSLKPLRDIMDDARYAQTAFDEEMAWRVVGEIVRHSEAMPGDEPVYAVTEPSLAAALRAMGLMEEPLPGISIEGFAAAIIAELRP